MPRPQTYLTIAKAASFGALRAVGQLGCDDRGVIGGDNIDNGRGPGANGLGVCDEARCQVERIGGVGCGAAADGRLGHPKRG